VLVNTFGNLEALRVLTIHFVWGCRHDGRRFHKGGGDGNYHEVELIYWQAFASALGRVRQHIELRFDGSYNQQKIDFAAFAVAIQGVSTIRTFYFTGEYDTYWQANTLMSALASLPSLEKVTLGSFDNAEVHAAYASFPGLTNLLKSSSLRSIEFSGFYF
jgi:hypothetical protein